MRKSLPLVVAASVLTSGCALFGRGVNAAPDEFAVARNAPLVIPPDYSLTPPAAGAITSTPQDAQQQAIEALFGGPSPRSASEVSLLDQAGRDHAALGARSIVGDPETKVVDKGAVTQTILSAPQSGSEVASTQVP